MEIYLADTPHRRNARHFGGALDFFEKNIFSNPQKDVTISYSEINVRLRPGKGKAMNDVLIIGIAAAQEAARQL